jgi:hypothetical protein
MNKTFTRVVSLLLAAGALALPLAAAAADAVPARPAAVRFYPLLGYWKGQAQLAQQDQPTIVLALSLSCRKASSGWAVRCDMVGRNDTMIMTESDLMGVDPVTGTGHWYAVSNQGETHDHIAEWPDPNTMKAHYAWTQDGKQMLESIVFQLIGKNALEFRSTVTADGAEVGSFSGKLAR